MTSEPDLSRAAEPGFAFLNPIWHSLQTHHAALAIRRPGHGGALRYPPEVLRFAAVRDNTSQAMRDLHALLDPGESVYLFSTTPSRESTEDSGAYTPPATVPGLVHEYSFGGLQMILPAQAPLPSLDPGISIAPLSVEDVPAMLALIAVAFPGYFFRRTLELGAYYGVWQGGELVSMGGERLAFGPYVEISAVCTHPAHTGRGYAAAIIARLLHEHRAEGRQSFLHLAAANARARALYERLGFRFYRTLDFQRFIRRD
ncbi:MULTISPECIES: GNAT family N-acetyltransferase [Acidobacterium]|uniref:Acetyltransferase, GNAT family n=1 Tax=Acidobacterium capsulatum (strain ATCC 51196 / DSM 11244 / BCRC 80197 / JCM 7670 / NBRC 15755 / NCIMB 13165 / 161) TaxID=240015 RepID=C1F3P1_ACIC5|nr:MULTISPECIES: GNAT family N-acetyltransferase [Acidobacterium]ACO32436.1 acetyltransferase, GNAT family [Acidobacterium capsulatum ATCC 51196]